MKGYMSYILMTIIVALLLAVILQSLGVEPFLGIFIITICLTVIQWLQSKMAD